MMSGGEVAVTQQLVQSHTLFIHHQRGEIKIGKRKEREEEEEEENVIQETNGYEPMT
jgi:hypothetical protein